MAQFLSKHANAVIGTLSGFDRLVFRGTLRRLAHSGGMMSYLWAMGVLLKDFVSHAEALTRRLKEASTELARRTSRPVRYLPSSATSKEQIAREIARADLKTPLIFGRILLAGWWHRSALTLVVARDGPITATQRPAHRPRQNEIGFDVGDLYFNSLKLRDKNEGMTERADGITEGLICVLTAVEPCLSYEIVRDRESKHLKLTPRHRKCLFLYHYQIHPVFGFMHARIQTWFPFSVQICINGREWLARSMDAAGSGYVQRENCFTWIEDPARAQRLMDQQVKAAWPDLLDAIARGLNPLHDDMFQACPVDYYWSTYQSEWATDILFQNPKSLARLYPKLVHHGLTTFLSPDVMRFLGRNISPSGHVPPQLKAEVASDIKTRPEGVRIKHRLGGNSIKMYDKQGSVLRVETTINDAAGFKSFRTPEGKPDAKPAWHTMRKGIADLHRRADVSQAANGRYLQALASVEDTRSLGELTTKLCQPVKRGGRDSKCIEFGIFRGCCSLSTVGQIRL